MEGFRALIEEFGDVRRDNRNPQLPHSGDDTGHSTISNYSRIDTNPLLDLSYVADSPAADSVSYTLARKLQVG